MENLYVKESNSDKKTLLNVFGAYYVALSNFEELKKNYQEISSLKNNLLDIIINMIIEDHPRKVLYLKPWELDLLILSSNGSLGKEQTKYITYYGLKELNFIKILKNLANEEYEVTEEDKTLLYSFIRSQKDLETLISTSGNNQIALTTPIIKILYRLITNKYATVGHNIKAYERLCSTLSLTNAIKGPHLELVTPKN